MASYNNSGSSATTWEGIEGFNPEFLNSGQVQGMGAGFRDKQKQQLMSGQDLASKYGFIFGEDKINKLFQDSMNSKYEQIEGLTRQARDTSLMDMGSNYDQYLQTMRDQKAKGTQTGIMRGANMASEVQGLLGTQESASKNQTEYAKTMANLADEKGKAAYDAQIDAMKYNNELGNMLGTLGVNKYGMDVQDEAAYLAYLGQYDQGKAALLQGGAAWNDIQGKNTRKVTSQSSSWANSGDDGGGYGGGYGGGGSAGAGGEGGESMLDAMSRLYPNIPSRILEKQILGNATDRKTMVALNKKYNKGKGSSITPAPAPGGKDNPAIPNKGNGWSVQGSWAGGKNGLF